VSATRRSVFDPEIPALPTGYSGLPRELVEASQRQRLIHAVTMAVADKGFAAATVTDITERAGVSKKTFYELFHDKLACFLAAYDHGARAMLEHTAHASMQARAEGASAIEQLRAGTHDYLEFLVFEEPYARTFCLEMLAAGPEAVARHRACRESFAGSVGAWYALNRPDHPEWPDLAPFAFEAATGVVHEVTSARIAAGRVAELPAVEDDLMAAQLAILGVTQDPAREAE
jgi:AcrR family transcriptional regulator